MEGVFGFAGYSWLWFKASYARMRCGCEYEGAMMGEPWFALM